MHPGSPTELKLVQLDPEDRLTKEYGLSRRKVR
jgi:hypothetical protein